jgi:dephospho-CoA kinase
MQIYGLTGGIGSGKSEVRRRLAARGVPVMDADMAGHEVLEPGGLAVEAVLAAFGDAILTGGRIDRDKLAAIVFADAAARKTLNAIVHPLIGMRIAEHCVARVQEGHSAIVVEATLFAENGTRETWLDGLILVLSREDIRLERLTGARGMSREDALKRIAAQTPPEQKEPLADWVIHNNGSIEELHAATDPIARQILAQGR